MIVNYKTLNQKKLQNALEERFSGPSSSQSLSIEEEWTSFRDTVHSTSFEVLGAAQRKNQDWFDGNDSSIEVLLEKKITYFQYSKVVFLLNQNEKLSIKPNNMFKKSKY